MFGSKVPMVSARRSGSTAGNARYVFGDFSAAAEIAQFEGYGVPGPRRK